MFYCVTYWTNLNKHQCSCYGACCADILNEDKYECKDEATRSAKNWKLVRERDGLTKQSNDIMWLEFNADGTFKEKHDKPAIGLSLLMSPFNNFFTWQTTSITEIMEEREDYIKFKTLNSNYELFNTRGK